MTAGLTTAALQRFLDAVEPERGGSVTAVTPLTGGYSRDTPSGRSPEETGAGSAWGCTATHRRTAMSWMHGSLRAAGDGRM